MAQRVLAGNAGVESVRYSLPNQHYIPVDMKYIGLDNTTPYVSPDHIFCFLGIWGFNFGYLFNCISETIPFVENVICLVLWSRS
jgi:hypothetical protein